jgi:hypothetical protein
MPTFHRSFNPYSSAPPPPVSLPDYIIDKATTQSLTNEEAGARIDQFLGTQDGKVLALHRLADHLLGRKQIITDTNELEELGNVLDEERRREGGVVYAQPDDEAEYHEIVEPQREEQMEVPTIQVDKKKARKEERRLKKEREREKRKTEEIQIKEKLEEPTSKKPKKKEEHKSHNPKPD